MRPFLHKYAFVALLITALLPCGLARAQSGEPQQSTPSAENAPGNAAPEKESQEDQTAQFKHSASVRFLGRITGLGTEGGYWLAVGLNFLIVVGAIWWLSRKNLPTTFRNRTATIQKQLEEARKASEDANRRLSDIESRLARLDNEISEMRALSEKEAAAEEQRIKVAAEEESRRIAEAAEQEIASATKSARRELAAYAADLAVTLASKQIQVDAPTDQALVRRFAQQLSGDGTRTKRN
jgi:F-type H+-transporting ATPase subunit b